MQPLDIGVLASLLSVFEEPARITILQNATFEEDDAGQVLVLAGPREQLRFSRGADPGTGAPGTSGGVSLGTSLERLAGNGWLGVNIGRHRTEVRLGKLALELRDRT